ncbi:hypothetical protein [Nostoc sp.]|uniref:hypothetical protein n=1 Tax=Nostoc sp. TaxID=1180 RepID=UPI002FFA8DC1
MKLRLSINWLIRSNKYKYLAIAYILKDAATLTKTASATSMKSTQVDLVCVAATSSRQLPKTICTATPVIMEAMSPTGYAYALDSPSFTFGSRSSEFKARSFVLLSRNSMF